MSDYLLTLVSRISLLHKVIVLLCRLWVLIPLSLITVFLCLQSLGQVLDYLMCLIITQMPLSLLHMLFWGHVLGHIRILLYIMKMLFLQTLAARMSLLHAPIGRLYRLWVLILLSLITLLLFLQSLGQVLDYLMCLAITQMQFRLRHMQFWGHVLGRLRIRLYIMKPMFLGSVSIQSLGQVMDYLELFSHLVMLRPIG